MKINRKIVAAAVLAAMVLAYASCTKDNVKPTKASTYHPNARLATSGDSSGGDNPPIPPQ